MSLIEWQDEWRVGVASVDAEHRELIELINDVHDLADSEASRESIITMLGEIYARISAHFALEERHMRESRYAEYEEHKRDHESLLDELRDIMDDVEHGSRLDEAALSGQLERWFSVHFRTLDARLHQHFTVD